MHSLPNQHRLGIGIAAVAAMLLAVSGCAIDQPESAEEVRAMTPTQRHFFNTPLGDVHYIDAGQAERPPVVLLHQTPRSVDEFAEVIPILAERHRVLAVDNPGYGCSDTPPRQPTVEEYADVVVALLDHLAIPRAHLVGHHTGAILAVDIAARHPSRVERLVL